MSLLPAAPTDRNRLSRLGGPIAEDALDPNKPGYIGTPVDPQTSELIDQKFAQSQLNDSAIADQTLRGTGSSYDTSHSNDYSNALGGPVDPAMQRALQDRAQRHYGSSVNQLQQQANLNAPITRSKNLSTGMAAVGQLQDLNNRNNNMQYQSDINQKMIRNSAISNLFQGGGAVLGSYAGRNGKKKKSNGEQSQAMETSDSGYSNDAASGNYGSETYV